MPERRSSSAVNAWLLVIGLGWLTAVHLLATPRPNAPDKIPLMSVSDPGSYSALLAPLASAVAAPSRAAQTPTPTPQGGYVGSDTCIACHDEQEKSYVDSPHGKAANPRAPAAARGCETCHGPGEKHIEDPADNTTLRKFTRMSPRDANDTCLSCHTRSPHTLWRGSPHETRNLACINCHSVHNPQSPQAHLKTATEVELCATCHRVQATKIKRVSHMPLQENKMSCSTCHNPHGSTNVRQLRVGNWINESCVSCHTEKRGPFLFEHAAGRESCVSCHDPHGSSNERLLVAKLPMLCQRCHIGTRHPSTIYDSAAFQNKSVRVIGRACVNCHSQIHGSNHPAGQAFTR
jgi:DmsE family decaheme c-type cytochrome